MTDHYKTTLKILAKILKEENYDHWADWMQEDIKLWEINKNTEHHLRAYGGMGSFNDIGIGGDDVKGIWKGHIFGHLQTLAYSLANGNTIQEILKANPNQHLANEISGWRCINCGDARMNNRNINLFVAHYFIPKFFVNNVQEDKLNEVINIPERIDSEEVINKRNQIKSLIQQANILLNPDDDWLWICPKCGSSKVCSYRWNVLADESKMVEGNDNLEIKIE